MPRPCDWRPSSCASPPPRSVPVESVATAPGSSGQIRVTTAFIPISGFCSATWKTSTSVEATKAFLRLAQMAPFEAQGQVFCIANAETLSGEAANALLKTLEEPPVRTPRNFLLLSPSQLDLLPTIRSRSLPVFLGSGQGLDGERIDDLAQRFAASLEEFRRSGSSLHLIAAAADLGLAGDWQDPRAAEPWSLAAAAVKQSCEKLPAADRRRLLALSENLLTGWQLRLRGIQAPRILEGMVVKHIAR